MAKSVVKKVAVGVAASSMLLLMAGPAAASHQLYNSNGKPIHWARPSNPAVVYMLDSTTSAYRGSNIPTNVMNSWAPASSIFQGIRQVDNSATTRQNCPYADGSLREIRVCNYDYNNANWSGVAVIKSYVDSGHIVGAKIKLDNQDLTTDALRRSVLCQEWGHTLGLDHQGDGSTSCMDDGGNQANPNSHDFSMLDNQTYAHCDASGGCGGTKTVDSGTIVELSFAARESHRSWTRGDVRFDAFLIADRSTRNGTLRDRAQFS